MKTGNYLRSIVFVILCGIFPSVLSANELMEVKAKAPENQYPQEKILVAESAPEIFWQEDKGKTKKNKRPETEEVDKNKPKDVEVEKPRPDIKQVPKSRPKLRPGVVTDGIKIKRPPVRVGKPGRG